MIRCNDGRYLGYFHNLPEVLAKYPTGRRGWFFTNGETLSVWMWDELSRGWHDTNCVDDTLQGVVDDAASFEPVAKPGVKTSYLYVQPEAGTVTFRNFVNGEVPVSVTTEGTAVILLFWNGDLWEVAITPFYVDLARYALKDLSNVEDEKVKEMAGITEVFHEQLPDGGYDAVIVLGTDDAADRGASIGITSQGVPFITTHHFLDTPIENRKTLALADLSNVTQMAGEGKAGLMSVADKQKLDSLMMVRVDVGAALNTPVIASRGISIDFLGGLSLNRIITDLGRSSGYCFYYSYYDEGKLVAGSFDFEAEYEYTQKLTLSNASKSIVVELSETKSGGEVNVSVRLRNVVVAAYRDVVAAHDDLKAGYLPSS